ncbi:hypothetical protein BaRGS_00024803 [Batillaria attramentaria]|uniref:Secreted protein n=1 Tax=Batillaria attramentaria TaxID=370345 RepID=A0ABD0KA18_9CAEN
MTVVELAVLVGRAGGGVSAAAASVWGCVLMVTSPRAASSLQGKPTGPNQAYSPDHPSCRASRTIGLALSVSSTGTCITGRMGGWPHASATKPPPYTECRIVCICDGESPKQALRLCEPAL